jgi:hypothetical protein
MTTLEVAVAVLIYYHDHCLKRSEEHVVSPKYLPKEGQTHYVLMNSLCTVNRPSTHIQFERNTLINLNSPFLKHASDICEAPSSLPYL